MINLPRATELPDESFPRQRRTELRFGALLLMIAVASLSACVSSHVLVGAARAPIPPEQVKVYMRAPAQYDQIAILDTSSRYSWTVTAQGKTDKVIERLKIQAAQLGANGVLLQDIQDHQSGSLGIGIGSGSASGSSVFGLGLGSSASTYQKSGKGIAIYVSQE